MRTSNYISTVSYNTEDYLVNTLRELHDEHIISDWICIHHKGEDDEKKEHFHVWMNPNRLIDTMDLQLRFLELDPNHTDKPLKCRDFHKGKIDDWILYNQHFAPYLATKFESRRYYYQKEDFRYCDEDTFEFYYYHAFHSSEFAVHNQILAVLKEEDACPTDLIDSGVISLNQASQLNSYMYMKTHYGYTDRNGRKGHEEE